VALLTDDASLTMPPTPLEYIGPTAIAGFLPAGGRLDHFRLVSTRANGQPAFGCYQLDARAVGRAYGLMVLVAGSRRPGAISRSIGCAASRAAASCSRTWQRSRTTTTRARRRRKDPWRTTGCASSSRAVTPALAPEAQVALTLRLLGGLSTEQVARAFLVAEATMAQRLVRAKRRIKAARIPVVYLIANAGVDDRGIGAEAIRLARLLATLMPDEPEVAGLFALVLSESRRASRTAATARSSCSASRTADAVTGH
jgi:hypothetical protein